MALEGTGPFLIELGALLAVLALLARGARWLGLSPIPLYLGFGLALGPDGVFDPVRTTAFLETGGELGLVLLLFMLGVEYTGDELKASLRTGLGPGVLDLVLNFVPGLVAGLALGFGLAGGLVLGGVTYISSSGVIAKLLRDLDRVGNRETPAILSILVLEDLAMAVLLPIITVVLFGSALSAGLVTVGVAAAASLALLLVAMRAGEALSRPLGSPSNEVTLLTLFGLLALVAGLTEELRVSAAVGAFLFGLAVSGPLVERAQTLLEPLRDLFAALFFLFFGLSILPAAFPPVIVAAVVLFVVTATTKVVTGWVAAGRVGAGPAGRLRAGMALTARGEFSIIIAGLGLAAGLSSGLGALAAAYVTLSAVAGPLLARASDPIHRAGVRWLGRQGGAGRA